MPIDSEAKRRSVPRWITGLPGMSQAPIPDGALDAGDRQQIAGVYRGIAAGAPGVLPSALKRKGTLLRVY
jgi:hypothetical protein